MCLQKDNDVGYTQIYNAQRGIWTLMNDTVRTGLNRVRLPISPSAHIINNYYTDFLNKSQEKKLM